MNNDKNIPDESNLVPLQGLGVNSPLRVRGKILICPLNWGLGHATRCVPIIRKLMAEGHEPVVVADGFPLAFLRQEFPSLRFIEFPSYKVYYAAGKSQVGAMLFNFPSIIKGIVGEHFWLRKLLQSEHFDQIISDNRFGLWNRHVHSIYMTHQLMIKMPNNLNFLEPLVHCIHKTFINRYNQCWIPDRAENGGLSGDLSHKYPLPRNARFIGVLSRFHGLEDTPPNADFDIVAVVSGVEPQRTILEDNVLVNYRNRAEKVLIVRGQPHAQQYERHIGNITLMSHLPDAELAAVLLGAKKIICRSGYSSIMDLDVLKCLHKAQLIPTSGQTEQEYLYSQHIKK
jgi:predicted glycosyltransferase